MRDPGFDPMKLGNDVKQRLHAIPYASNPRFCGRDDELEHVRSVLNPARNPPKVPKTMALVGLGGVGKTQLALQYAIHSREHFWLIAWLPSETITKLQDAVSAVGCSLGLIDETGQRNPAAEMAKVKDWLIDLGKPFLLIFDNVDNVETILPMWPVTGYGSLLLTTQSPSVASNQAPDTIHLKPFLPSIARNVIQDLTGLRPDDDEEKTAMQQICKVLGGLPLAIVQVSNFMKDRGYSYTEFLGLYQKSSEKVLQRLEAPAQYPHGLDTVWNLALDDLPDNAKRLLQLLAFVDADSIDEVILTNPEVDLEDPDVAFLLDEFAYGDAVAALKRASLIERLTASKALSIHRLVQDAVMLRLGSDKRIRVFAYTTKLLYYSFPNTWREKGAHQGHGYPHWAAASRSMSHVERLMDVQRKYSITPQDSTLLAELLFRSGTHCWETEQPTLGEKLLTYGLSLGVDRSSETCNAAIRMLGHIALDKGQPRKALIAYKECLVKREELLGPDEPAIADVLDSIACSYVELGEVEKAGDAIARAITIHEAHDPKRMARTRFIEAMNYLRAIRHEDALQALKKCWQLQGLDLNQVEKSRYPKHSGDLILLSRIKFQQGLLEEAMQIASRTITIRKAVLGPFGPRVADSMYTVAGMLRADGDFAPAAKLLREIIDMAESMLELRGHLARACWTLAAVEEQLGHDDKVEALKDRAREVRSKIVDREVLDEDTDAGFAGLVPWLLP